MGLPRTIVKQFAEVAGINKNESSETLVYATITSSPELNTDGVYTARARIDGSNVETAVLTSASVKNKDRVMVSIKNHTAAVVGNLTDPSASGADLSVVGKKVDEYDLIVADKASIDDLEAERARIDALVADNVTINNKLSANTAEIEKLVAEDVTINNKLTADRADIDTLNANYVDITKKLTTAEADIGNLKADYVVINKKLIAAEGSIENFSSMYANIDFSNITKAAMEYFYSQSGLIDDVTIGDATITGKLVGVTIDANMITTGTLATDRLLVKGEDGLYYKLNIEAGVVGSEEITQADLQNGLHGDAIITKSVTADKISVTDLVAFGASIGGFNLTSTAIYSGVKESVDNTTRGVYLDSTGQIAAGDADYFIKYYKTSSGTYKLDIAAESIRFGVNNTDLETAVGDAAKTATDFLGFSNGGLVVGDMTADELGNNVLIDSDSVDIRTGETVCASFGADYLYLAKNSRNAKIDFCNGLATIYHASKYSYDSLFVIDTIGPLEVMGGKGATQLALTGGGTGGIDIQFANANGVMGGIGMIGSWLRRYGSNMFDTYTILDKGNYFDVMDSGWFYTGGYGENFSQYNNETYSKVRYRKIGGTVEVRGAMKPTKIIEGSTTQYELFTLPEGYRPDCRIVQRCQGSGANTWMFIIDPSGVATFSRYGNGSTYVEVNTSTWLPFQITFFVD